MALMIIAGEKYDMPIWLKARLLEVQPTETANVLSVESGSTRGKFYRVVTDGIHAVSCPCDARIEQCAHVIAADRYLELERAQAQNEMDEAAVVAPAVLGEMAQDLDAHIDDELSVPVFLDRDGYYGRVRVDGKIEELSVSEIRERFPRFKVVSGEEFYESEQQAAWAVLSKERQRQLYSELYPDDYGYVA